MFSTSSWVLLSRDELGVAFTIAILVVSFLFILVSNSTSSSDRMLHSDVKSVYSRRFAHLRISPELIQNRAASKNKLVMISRSAKRLLKFVLRNNNESSLELKSWGFTSDSISTIDPNSTPLLCFVNCKSGGKQGKVVLGLLKDFLGPNQVFDLSSVDPAEVLTKFICLPSLRVLVAGGDGSVGWVLTCLEKLPLDARPPLAILPLGTGNDLARVLGWGHTVEVLLL